VKIIVSSFGFKHRAPPASDLLYDARFLPNPYWQLKLRDLTGRDAAVKEWMWNQRGVRQFVDETARFAAQGVMAAMGREDDTYHIAIGCTGGRHRSVYVAEFIYTRLVSDPRFCAHMCALQHTEIQ
jgi:UPF0042 nucleotide-binding protein